MRKITALFVVLSASCTPPVWAQSIEVGVEMFRHCKACHQIADHNKLIVPGGTSGPNLFGIIGRRAADISKYTYSDGLLRAGELGLVWTKENFIQFTANPNVFLSDFTGEDLVSKMPVKRRDGVAEIADYLEFLAQPK